MAFTSFNVQPITILADDDDLAEEPDKNAP